jgi:hypothetical protein
MDFDRLNKMSKKIFGINILLMYQERKISEKCSILITEFCANGFFWGQFEDELVI